jgi:hypothetical protein
MVVNAERQDLDQQGKSKQQKIDMINEWVRAYLEDGDKDARVSLLAQFHPFLIKQSKKHDKLYPGVHPIRHAIHESQIIFCDLLDEFTIGGTAYFNVYIQRKLPFRLRYFFVKEIRRRMKYLSHSDEQFMVMYENTIPSVADHSMDVIRDIDKGDDLLRVMEIINDGFTITDRDKAILLSSMFDGRSHEQIANMHGVSRSRISTIIKNTIMKIRKELIEYDS